MSCQTMFDIYFAVDKKCTNPNIKDFVFDELFFKILFPRLKFNDRVLKKCIMDKILNRAGHKSVSVNTVYFNYIDGKLVVTRNPKGDQFRLVETIVYPFVFSSIIDVAIFFKKDVEKISNCVEYASCECTTMTCSSHIDDYVWHTEISYELLAIPLRFACGVISMQNEK